MDQLFQKLDTLRTLFPDSDSASLLSEWEKTAKEAMVVANLQDNAGVKIIVDNYQKELDRINSQLEDNEALFLSDDGRQLGLLLHERKKWCKKFLGYFTIARSTVEAVTKSIDNALVQDNAQN